MVITLEKNYEDATSSDDSGSESDALEKNLKSVTIARDVVGLGMESNFQSLPHLIPLLTFLQLDHFEQFSLPYLCCIQLKVRSLRKKVAIVQEIPYSPRNLEESDVRYFRISWC